VGRVSKVVKQVKCLGVGRSAAYDIF